MMASSKQMNAYFFNGEFHKCYAEAKKLPEDDTAKKYIQLFTDYEYDTYPIPTKELPQSLENADETYPDFDELKEIRSIKEEQAFQNRIQQLEEIAKNGTPEEKAYSFFTQGHLFLFAHQNNESVHCFEQAVKHNPNKAIYWGFTGQTMHRFGWMPFDVLGYLEKAIELDPQNPRWKWNKGLVLTQLYRDLQQTDFLENALIVLEEARDLCRPEQASLKTAIQNTLDNMDGYVFS